MKKVYIKNEINEELLSSMIGKRVKIKYRHYSYHEHLTEREGIVEKYKENKHYVYWGEAAFINDIYQLQLTE